MRRRRRRWAVAAVVLGVLATTAVRFGPGLVSADASSRPAATVNVSAFYLVVGASSSLGFQPTGIPAHNGHRTSRGYSDDLVALESKHGVQLTMREIGCPGETTKTMLGETDKCYIPPGTQINAARIFLKKHLNDFGLVTIDLGFNDVRPCLITPIVDEACAARGVAQVVADMPKDLARLKASAGTHVHFIGLLAQDPFLGYYLLPASGPVQAAASLAVITSLNRALSAAYSAAGIAMANVPGAFKSGNSTLVHLSHVGVVPQNVATACTLTWLCTAPPWGPDDHPNDAGYRVIASAIAAAMPRSW